MSNRWKYQTGCVQTHYFVGLQVRLELQHRLVGGFGTVPKPLSDDAFNMGGYCLDAHEVLPAGSVQFHRFGPDEDDWIFEPTICMRSGEE